MLNVMTFLKDSFPALWNCTRYAYIFSGDEPVGKPSTKGRSGVGAKAVMRSRISCARYSEASSGVDRTMRRLSKVNHESKNALREIVSLMKGAVTSC